MVKKATPKKSVKKAIIKKSTSKKLKDNELPVQLIHTGKCPTLSERSTLTFQVGVLDGNTYIRVYSNTGGGMHSKTWIPVAEILGLLEKHPKGGTVTSYALHKLFVNRSANDAPFYFAVCLYLKLVNLGEKKRQYAYDSSDAFLAQVDKFKAAK